MADCKRPRQADPGRAVKAIPGRLAGDRPVARDCSMSFDELCASLQELLSRATGKARNKAGSAPREFALRISEAKETEDDEHIRTASRIEADFRNRNLFCSTVAIGELMDQEIRHLRRVATFIRDDLFRVAESNNVLLNDDNAAPTSESIDAWMRQGFGAFIADLGRKLEHKKHSLSLWGMDRAGEKWLSTAIQSEAHDKVERRMIEHQRILGNNGHLTGRAGNRKTKRPIRPRGRPGEMKMDKLGRAVKKMFDNGDADKYRPKELVTRYNDELPKATKPNTLGKNARDSQRTRSKRLSGRDTMACLKRWRRCKTKSQNQRGDGTSSMIQRSKNSAKSCGATPTAC